MRKFVLIALVVSTFSFVAHAQIVFPGANGTWNGYQRYTFNHDYPDPLVGSRTFATNVYAPTQAAEGNPWVMRAMWWGYNSEVDQGLLERGYHVVYVDNVAHCYGAPDSMMHWDELYDNMTTNYGLAEKAILIGGSRGALQAHHWARDNTEKVQSIFTNVGVCDIMSWPGTGGGDTWRNLKYGYGFCTEAEYAADPTAGDAEAAAWEHNIVDDYTALVEANIPIFSVAGDSDATVPLEDNGQLLYDRFVAAGGEMRLEVVEGGTHSTTWDDYMTSVGGDLTDTLDYITAPSYQTPEPATMTLLGMAGAWLITRRGKNKRS